MRRNAERQRGRAYARASAACAALLCVLCAAQTASARRQEGCPANRDAWQQTPLEPGQPAARDLRPGETYQYRLTLGAGRFVRISFRPEGCDLVVSVSDPGGARRDEYARPGTGPEPEPLAFMTEAGGVYLVEVRSPAGAPCRYAPALEENRPADPLDRTRIEAERAYSQAARTQAADERRESALEAIKGYERAYTLWRDAGERACAASALGRIGGAYDSLEEYRRAVESYTQRLKIVRELGDRQKEGDVSEKIGQIYYEHLREKENALTHLADALRVYGAEGDREGEADVLTVIGKVYAELGATPEEKRRSLAHLVRALEIQRAQQNRYNEADALGNLMFAWRSLGRPREAIFFGKQAVDIFQKIRSGMTDLEADTQETFIKSKEDIYRTLAAMLIEDGRLSAARQVIGMLKVEEYHDYVRGRDEPPPVARRTSLTPEEAGWEKEYKKLGDKVSAIGREYGELFKKGAKTPRERRRQDELAAKLEVARTAFNEFVDGLKSAPGDMVHGRLENVEDARNMGGMLEEMGPGVVALYTLVTKDKFYGILLTPHAQRPFEYKITAAELWNKVHTFREELKNKQSNPLPLAQELYKILVGPVQEELNAAKATKLMWSFDWALRYIPVAALHDGTQYMVERYTNTIFTPASTAYLRDLPKERGRWKGVGFGVSKAHDKFSELPCVPGELRGIFSGKAPVAGAGATSADWVMQGEILLDDYFVEKEFKSLLGQNRPVVHIASHFKFDSGDGQEPFLLLGKGGQLPLSRIKALSFRNVELLTLSACDTAMTGDEKGKEVEGFAVEAQRSSAKAVVATLWQVADASTAQLMRYFYRYKADHPEASKAEALRQSQLALLRDTAPADPTNGDCGGERSSKRVKDGGGAQGAAGKLSYSHPYFWAPFLLIGNWR